MAYNSTEHHTNVFLDFLSKESEDSTALKNNEDEVVRGENPTGAISADDGRASSGPEAPWGEDPLNGKDGGPQFFSDVARSGFEHSRQRLLDELFASKKPATEASRALLKQRFNNSDQFETRSVLLEKEPGKVASAPETLSEAILRVTGG